MEDPSSIVNSTRCLVRPREEYQFAVLLTNENRVEILAESICGEDFPDLRFHLDIAPSPRELPLHFAGQGWVEFVRNLPGLFDHVDEETFFGESASLSGLKRTTS